jgi:uncharacterized protein
MVIVISPSKNLDTKNKPKTKTHTQPLFLQEAEYLIEKLCSFSVSDIARLMNINPKLAELNVERYMQWKTPFTPENSKQSILMFKGEVFLGLDAGSLTEHDFEFAQEHLRVLSGLYGILRPMDLIQPYRLEMGTSFQTGKSSDLYAYWKPLVTEQIQHVFRQQGDNTLINLASKEYFKAIDTSKAQAKIITPVFKEYRDGKYKFVTFYMKKARGLMTRFIIENRITEAENIKAFDLEGYSFNEQLSDENQYLFTR